MKPRQLRRNVMICARLRDGFGWSDARILNVSTRGLMVRASKTPRRGAYVELCRGPHRIVARVVWVEQDRFGVCTQDEVAIDAIANGVEAGAPCMEYPVLQRGSRRRQPFSEERRERSRKMASTIQFVWIVGFGAAMATLAFDIVRSTLSRPLAIVTSELSRQQ